MRKLKDYLVLYLKGLAMGTADVIPGVSGGTIAFITGIYDELIQSIRSINIGVVKTAFKGKFKEVWQTINGNFLIAVLAGIGTSLISLAGLMSWLLQTYPVQIWSFFFGLILVSAPMIFRDIENWNFRTYVALLIGIGAAYSITILTPSETPTHLWFIFFCGALAICAMILPGISGAFILLLIGKYQYLIDSLITLNIPVLLVFIIGCVIGLTSFSHVLNWLLTKHRPATLALLAGFMLGSLNKVWPWKQVTEWRISHAGEQVPAFDKSIWPTNYLHASGQEPQIWSALIFCTFGILLVVAIERLAAFLRNKSNL